MERYITLVIYINRKSRVIVYAGIFLFLLFTLPSSAFAASRYWVGGSGNWSDNTNHWAASSGGSPGATIPTSSDDCLFDANSFSGAGQTVTLTADANCLNLDFTGTTNSPNIAGSSWSLNVYGNATFISSMSYSIGQTAFKATSTGHTIKMNGLTVSSGFTFNGVGGGWVLQDNLNTGNGYLQLTAGSLDLNSKTISSGTIVISGSSTKTLTMGTSNWTVTNNGSGGSTIINNSGSNLTVTANTATIILNTITNLPIISPGSINWNGASIVFTPVGATTITLNNSPTFANITLNGPASQSQVYSFTAGVTWTATGTFTTAGNSISNRIRVASATRGSSVTLSAATWNNSYADFEDINATGTGTFSSSATAGDLGGNSGNFVGRTPATFYWVGNGGNYSDTTHWSTSSGGSTASTIPLPQDTALIDNNSFSTNTNLNVDVTRIGTINASASTNGNGQVGDIIGFTTYGSLIEGTKVWNLGGSGKAQSMDGRGINTLSIPSNSGASQGTINVDAITGTVNLGTSFAGNNGTGLSIVSGTFNTHNFNMVMRGFSSSNSNTRYINLGSSTITINANPNPSVDFSTTTGLTFNPGTSTIILNVGVNNSFNGGGLTWYNVQIQSTTTTTFTGSNTFHSLTASATARTIIFTAGTTQTITSQNGFINGSAGAIQTLQCSTPGSPWTISSPLDQSSDYLSIQDSTAVQPSRWYAGYNSTNVSGNTNWIFTAPGYSIRAPSAYWKFDDGQGTTAKDSTTNGNNGTLSGSTLPTWQTEDQCISGKCLYFDGSNSYVSAYDTGFTTNFTVSAWIRPKSQAVYGIMGQRGGNNRTWGLYTRGDGSALGFTLGGATDYASSNGFIQANKWNYVTASINNTTLILYVNGIQVYTTNMSNTILDDGTTLRIGEDNYSTGHKFFAGFIDEVKIYPYTQSSAQILADYNTRGAVVGTSLTLSSQTVPGSTLSNGLVGYWKMDEASWNGTAGEVKDSSGNGNNGTAFNGFAGTATGGTSTTLMNSTIGVLSASIVGKTITIISGTGVGQSRTISSINNTTITVSSSWTAPDSTSKYIITPSSTTGTSSGSNTNTTLNDSSQNWTVNAFANTDVQIVSGTGSGQNATIASNSATQLTISTSWSVTPDSTSQYEIISTTTTGKYGNSGYFDGVEGNVTIPNSSVFNFNNQSFTISAWLKTSSGGGYPVVKGRGGLQGWQLGGGTTNILFVNDASNQNSCNNPTSFATGNWVYITGVLNVTTRQITCFVNGQLVGTTNISSATNLGNIDVNTTLDFASRNPLTSSYYKGYIDEVRIYNRALTPSEVSQLYNFAPGPIGYWKLDEGTGSTVADSSGNGNNGTWNGTGSVHWANGKYGKAGNFNGTDDYIGLTNPILTTKASAFTISMWVFLPTGFSSRWIGGREHNIILEYTGGAYGFKFTGGGNNYFAPATPIDNSWHYLTVSYDSSSQKYAIYIDGFGSGSTVTDPTNYDFNTSGTFDLGRVAFSPTPTYSAIKIDDVRIYNYVQTQQQIIQDMTGGSIISSSGSISSTKPATPIGYWKFDEGFGTTANNTGSGGSALNGTLTNMSSPATSTSGWTNSGKINKALNFDGSNDYINLGTNSSLNITGNITISAWVYPKSSANALQIISKSDSTSTNCATKCPYDFMINNGDLIFGRANASSRYAVSTTTSIPLNMWTYIAVVDNGSNYLVYFNDIQQPTTPTGSYITPTTSNNNAYIGARADFGTNGGLYFNGIIDEVKVYNFDLTSDQVKLDMNQGKTLVLGSTSNNSSYQPNAANQNYCILGDTSPCAAPVGEWNFEEGTGSTVNDTSGNGNTGTWSGTGARHWVPGEVGTAGNFNGSDDYVDAGNGAALNISGPLTIEFWMKMDNSYSPGYTYCILSKYCRIRSGALAGPYQIGWPSSSNLEFEISNNSTEDDLSFGNPSKGVWHHLTAVYDGSNMYTYLDGSIVNNKLTAIASLKTTGSHLSFGNNAYGSGFYKGLLDQIRVYNYARTPAQIAWDYNKGNPIAQWKLDECQGTTAHDASGNGNNGTISIGSGGSQTQAGTCIDGLSTSAWNNGKTGKIGASLNFDGTDDWVNVGTGSILQPGTGSYSVCTWETTTSPPLTAEAVTDLFGAHFGSGQSIELGLYNHNSLVNVRFLARNSIGGATLLVNQNVWDGKWHQLCGTLDASGGKSDLFIDGKLATSGSYSEQNLNSGTNPFIIGSLDPVTNGHEWTGKIDDVQIYNYALTVSQVKTLYNNGAVSYGLP